MKIITLNQDNLDQEHICCAFSDKKCRSGYDMKKAYLSEMMDRGFVFKKLDVRGKVFIEYVPADVAWAPIIATNYLMINCFWVSGQYKGQGWGNKLLAECLLAAKDMDGVVVMVGKTKKPFLSDKKYFIKKGFQVCDQAPPYFQLLVKKNDPEAIDPRFTDLAKINQCENKKGLTVYYSNQCPFTEYYVNVELKQLAEEFGLPLKIIKVSTQEAAKNNPSPFVPYSVYYQGDFITHEIFSRKKFEKFLDAYNLRSK